MNAKGIWLALSCGLLVCVLHLALRGSAVEAREDQDAARQQTSVTAFKAMLPVLRHPRCINCHAAGDYPRQGDDNHPHIMDVRRGPAGHGVNGVMCSTCHQDHNLPGVHVPPGAPGWALPPPATPMIWQGLTDRDLCELLKDPQQNGHRSVAQIVEHMHTPLVLWGWHPGDGRTAIPTSQQQFLMDVQVWASSGAACPSARRH